MKKLNTTNFRTNIYQVLDQAIKTGIPIAIERKGKKVRLVPVLDRPK